MCSPVLAFMDDGVGVRESSFAREASVGTGGWSDASDEGASGGLMSRREIALSVLERLREAARGSGAGHIGGGMGGGSCTMMPTGFSSFAASSSVSSFSDFHSLLSPAFSTSASFQLASSLLGSPTSLFQQCSVYSSPATR